MSGFGLLVLLLFVISTAGIIMLCSNGSSDVFMAKLLYGVVLLMTVAEFVLCFLEFPMYVVDGIVYASMGFDYLFNILLVLYIAVIVFILFMILPKLKWKKIFNVTVGKVIVCGVLIFCALIYTELFNGVYSFDSREEFTYAHVAFEQYDDGFFPFKVLKMKSDDHEENLLRVSVYPFDAHSAAGKLDYVYRSEVVIDKATGAAGFYPFNLKIIMGKGEPVSFSDPSYVPLSKQKKAEEEKKAASATDASATDGQSESAQPEQPQEGTEGQAGA